MREFITPVSHFHIFDRKNAAITDQQDLEQLTHSKDNQTGLSFIDHSYQSRYGSRFADIHLSLGFEKSYASSLGNTNPTNDENSVEARKAGYEAKTAALINSFNTIAAELGISESIGRVNGLGSRFVIINCNALAADQLAAYAKENISIEYFEDETRNLMQIPEYTYGYKVLMSDNTPTSHWNECDMELVNPYILLYKENEPVSSEALEDIERILQQNRLNGEVGVQLNNAANGQILIYCTGNELSFFTKALGLTKILSGEMEVASLHMML